MTIITALAFTIVVATTLAGVATVSMSHYDRSKVEANYAKAINFADAGINYELAWISQDMTDVTRAHSQGAPYTGTIAGLPGTFSVYTRDWGTNCDGGTWSQPNDICIVSTGTVDGVSRTVRIRGIRKSIYEEYAIYAYSLGVFNGGGPTQIIGNTGANGPVTFNGSANTDIVQGYMDLNGSAATSSDSGDNLRSNPDPVIMPTVNQVADKLFPGGLTYLQNNNSNASIRRLRSTDPTWAAETTVAGITVADVAALQSAGFTSASRSLTDPTNTVTSDTSMRDDITALAANRRFVQPADTTYGIAGYGVRGKRLYIFPPGDYYFTSFNVNGGNTALIFMTHLGMVRIWIDQPSSGASDDRIQVPVIFTDTTPSKFRLYYNKCRNISVGGNSRFNGSIYARRSGCVDNSTPGVTFGGGSIIYGSIISNGITVSGGSKIIFPNNGGTDISDYALWYGFKDSWKEISPNANPVFADGTSN